MSETEYLFGTFFIATVVYCVWLFLKPKYAGMNIPPFPEPKRFLTGHLHLVESLKEQEAYDACRAKAGDIFSVDIFGKLVVFVNGYENGKKVMVNHWNEAADRPTPHQHILDEVNCGVLNSQGENWKAQRTTAISILRQFGMGKSHLAGKIIEEVGVFIKTLDSYDAKPVDFRILINVSVSNVICAMVVGKRFEHDDPYFVKIVKQLEVSIKKVPLHASELMVSLAKYMPFDICGIKDWMTSVAAFRDEFSIPYINASKKAASALEPLDCFISVYLKKMKEETAKHATKYLNEKNLTSLISDLFAAGTETTSTTIYWCVLYCLHKPEVQDKVFKEINTYVCVDRLPTMDDKPKLCYLEALIRETQRIAAVVMLLGRQVTHQFELNGYTIPKDCTILVNLSSCLKDAQIWGDPHNFRPERFLAADGSLLNPEEFVPFGMGKRSCLAEGLAKMELFLFLAAMFQRFLFEPEDANNLPSTDSLFGLIRFAKPFKVRFVPRS